MSLQRWPPRTRRRLPAAVCHVHEAERSAGRPVRVLLAAPLLLARPVLVNSAAAKEALGVLAPVRARCRVLYNGVPGPEQPPSPSRQQSGTATLVLLGRLSPRKGTDVGVRALALLRDRGVEADLVLVGDVFEGYEWFSEELVALVIELGLEDHVKLVGFRGDVWPELAAADVVLVPSREEPFGNVAVEGALAQRPVVASAVQGLTEIVRPGETGLLVPPDDPEALADAVGELLADQSRALALASRARQDALARFSPESYARHLVHALEDTARRPRWVGVGARS